MSIVVILSLYYKLVFCTCLVWQLRAQFASNEYGSRRAQVRQREREHKKHGKKINRKLRKIQKNKLQSSRGGGRAWGDRRVDAARGKSRGKTWKHCRETCSLCTR